MKLTFRHMWGLASVLLLTTGAWDTLAQDRFESDDVEETTASPTTPRPFFYERFPAVLGLESRTYFSLQTMQGQQFGGQQPYSGVGVSHYLGSIADTVTLFNGQALVNNNGHPAGTVGAQQRWMTYIPGLNASIVGAGVYFDVSQSRAGNVFQQANVNLELYTQSAWFSRANGYFPVGRQNTNTGPAVNLGGAPGQISLVGNTVGFGGIASQQMDVALMGGDIEFGRKFFNYRMEAYGGYYNWYAPSAGYTDGVKGGVRGFITDQLSGNVSISHDRFFGTNVYGGVTFTFGGSGGFRPLGFANLMTQPVWRAQQVAVRNFAHEVNSFQAAHDVASGDVLHNYFVTQGGTGSGGFVDPTNIQSVLANPNFGNGSSMVLLNNNGNLTTPIALTQNGQQIIGGSMGVANIDFSQALGHAPGTNVLHLTGLGGQATLAPTSGNAVTLTNQNVVQGFTIDGSGGITNGISGNPGSSNATITGMVFQNIAGTGVIINPSTNTLISSSTFTNNGTDIKLDAVNSQIMNITSTGAHNGSISLGAGGNIMGTTTISNVNISGAGGFGGILLNNAQNGSTTNLTNVSVTGGTGAGVTVTNSQAGSIYTLTNVSILNTGGNGMSLQSSAGTFNVDSTSSITNTGASAFAINGGSMDVNYNGSISQGNNFAALDIANHTGTVTFGATSSITTTQGDGLQFNTDNGTYNINGTINMNGGDAMIFIADGNGHYTFNDPLINNAGLDAGVKIVGGGASAPVTTFNGLSITTDGTPGFTVTNSGLTTVTGTATVNTNLGTALNVNNTPVNMTFTSVTSTNSLADGVTLDSMAGTVTVNSLTVSGATNNGVSIDSLQNGATINLNNGSITGGAGAGVAVTNSQAGSTYNLTGISISNTGGNGILLQGGTGTFNVDSTSSITNTGDSAFKINGGSMDVNYNGSISQGNNFAALDISNHTGTVTFGATSSITTTLGDGLQFDANNGTYNLNGTINMNGGDAMIQIADGNGHYTFNNVLINNAGIDAGVKIVGGGASAPVTTFNGLNITTAGTPGFAVTNAGLTTVTGTAIINTNVGSALNVIGTPIDMVFDTVNSSLSGTNGMSLTGATGTLTINNGTIQTGAQGYAAINVDNSSLSGNNGLTLNLNNMTINGPTASPGIFVNGQSAIVPIVLNLSSTTVKGGNGDAGGNYGGGAGIQGNNATITLDLNSVALGGAGGTQGGGAGIGGSGGGTLSYNTINFGSGMTITNNGTATGGTGTLGGGAGVGGGGGSGIGNNATVLGTGAENGGNGTGGAGGGAGVGGGGGIVTGGTGTGASTTGTATGGTPGGQNVGNGGP